MEGQDERRHLDAERARHAAELAGLRSQLLEARKLATLGELLGTTTQLASSKLWVLYEFGPFHATGFGALLGGAELDPNDPDDPAWEPPEGARNFLYFDGHVENL